jgi:hypothetical protein
MITHKHILSLILIIACITLLILLIPSKTSHHNESVITINKHMIYDDELIAMFQKDNIDTSDKASVDEYIEKIIRRKLILQYGQSLDLDKTDTFLRAIESFWEQSLLKLTIDHKSKEIANDISISEQDIRDYYDSLAKTDPAKINTYEDSRDILQWRLTQNKQTQAFDDWITNLKSKSHISVNYKSLEHTN